MISGARIGPDVSVIGHDDLPTSELLDPPLATIALDGREMGRAVMARLLSGRPPEDYVAPVELVERASLQAPGIAAPPGTDAAHCGNSVTVLDTSFRGV